MVSSRFSLHVISCYGWFLLFTYSILGISLYPSVVLSKNAKNETIEQHLMLENINDDEIIDHVFSDRKLSRKLIRDKRLLQVFRLNQTILDSLCNSVSFSHDTDDIDTNISVNEMDTEELVCKEDVFHFCRSSNDSIQDFFKKYELENMADRAYSEDAVCQNGNFSSFYTYYGSKCEKKVDDSSATDADTESETCVCPSSDSAPKNGSGMRGSNGSSSSDTSMIDDEYANGLLVIDGNIAARATTDPESFIYIGANSYVAIEVKIGSIYKNSLADALIDAFGKQNKKDIRKNVDIRKADIKWDIKWSISSKDQQTLLVDEKNNEKKIAWEIETPLKGQVDGKHEIESTLHLKTVEEFTSDTLKISFTYLYEIDDRICSRYLLTPRSCKGELKDKSTLDLKLKKPEEIEKHWLDYLGTFSSIIIGLLGVLGLGLLTALYKKFRNTGSGILSKKRKKND